MPTLAHAQNAEPAEAVRDFNVPAQPLARALSAMAEQADIQIVYPDKEPISIQAPTVRGRMTARQALAAVLAGSGYTFRYLSPDVVTLVDIGGSDGEKVTGAVRVEGAQGSPYYGGAGVSAGVNGVNGSRDITATENTGSFTSGALTVGSKVPQAIKDVPLSVSVLTSARIEEQNITDFSQAMKQLPGITLVQGASSLENSFISRGFLIRSIQVDGGAAIITGSNNVGTLGYFPQIDMAQYDHVELLRGATGTLNGFGDPGGTVNLTRKKPLDHHQLIVEGQAGSWSNYRAMVDVTSPLALGGKLRGRLVMTYQNNHYFYDTAKDNKTLIYGIAEFDATPTTLVTAGISHSDQNSVPWFRGLPRYENGQSLGLPRSVSFAFPWNRWNFDTTEIFGGIEQKIAGDWTAKVNVTHVSQSGTQKVGQITGAVNPITGAGSYFAGQMLGYDSDQLSTEATVSGSFTILGQRQEVFIGANRVDSAGSNQTRYNTLVATFFTPYQPYPGGPTYCQDFGLGACPAGSIAANGPPIDPFHFNPRDALYNEPANPLANTYYRRRGEIQTGVYANLRLTAFDRLHLAASIRWSEYKYEEVADSLCQSIPQAGPADCFGKQIGDVSGTSRTNYRDTHVSWPPSASLSLDVTKAVTAYLSYTDSYQNQGSLVKGADHKSVGPLLGSNIEGGIKWAARGGRLNLSVAAYRIKQRGFWQIDFNYPIFQQIAPGITCCFLPDPNQRLVSEGLDFEATGEILRGWQIAAGYTYSKTKQEGSSFGERAGLPFTTIQPEHLYKLWTSYDFHAAGHTGFLSGLTVSGGINGQSTAYYQGELCVNIVAVDPQTGSSICKSSAAPDFVPFKFAVPSYTLASARIDYAFSPVWSLALNLENIFDKTYYQTVGEDPSGGNWYGAPRRFTVTARAKW